MKRIILNFALCTVLAAMMVGCKAMHSIQTGENATGKPYELVVVCAQQAWLSELGDTLQSILKQPVVELPIYEPMFDVMRILPNNFKSLTERHRNILVVNVSPDIKEPAMVVKYDATAKPQIYVVAQGPDNHSLAQYISDNRDNLLYVLEKAERDRKVNYAYTYPSPSLTPLVEQTFSIKMPIPDDYALRTKSDDMVWISQEFPTSSEGFFIYKYPYEGIESLKLDALIKARNRFASRIPGPREGSYMTTVSKVVDETGENYIPTKPDYKTIKIGEQPWIVMNGLWEVENYYMGGPFVSYTTVNKTTNEVITIDCYVYHPKKPQKRNLLRDLQHLVYMVNFPAQSAATTAK